MDKVNLRQKLDSFSDHWSPKVIADLNGQQVKLAKFAGAFDWQCGTKGGQSWGSLG